MRPTDIAHYRRDNVLRITWEDGVRSEYSAAYLRAWCPCAVCQGHGNTVTYHEPPPGLELGELFEMGAYAIGIRFSDGHDNGIYTWAWLRRISSEAPPAGLKRGSFTGDKFTPA